MTYSDKNYYAKNRDSILQKAKERRATGYYRKLDEAKNAKRTAAQTKAWFIHKKYGLTLDDWNLLFELQGKRCGACGIDNPRRIGRRSGWATDHDHVIGVVRGILCNNCNLALGWLGDNLNDVSHHSKLLVAYLQRVVINRPCIKNTVTPLTHYVIVRKDISPGQQAAQILHAAGESANPKPEPGCIAVALHADDGDHILELSGKLLQADIPHHVVIEDDGRLMAIGLRPTTDRDKVRKVLSSLPLVK